MENSFDAFSKRLAQVSRRQVLGTFIRGTLGAILASAGATRRVMRAQSPACSACGTCVEQNATTGKLVACKASCAAQALCEKTQSYHPYLDLTDILAALQYQAVGYSALISASRTSVTYIFKSAYTNLVVPGQTADIFTVWAPGEQTAAYAVTYLNGNPTYGYAVGASGVQGVIPPPAPPPPFVISASPPSVMVRKGYRTVTTVSTSVSYGFNIASGIRLTASNLPSGVSAVFSPTVIPAPGTGSSQMVISATAETAACTYTLSINGKGSGFTETGGLSLTVTPAESVLNPSVEVEQTPLALPTYEIDPSFWLQRASGPYCPTTCTVLTAVAGAVDAVICAEIVASIGTAACLTLPPPLSGFCLAGGFMAFGTAVSICASALPGAGAATGAICGYYCSCPVCQTPCGDTECCDTCISSCPPPAICHPTNCACTSPACGPGLVPCGLECCDHPIFCGGSGASSFCYCPGGYYVCGAGFCCQDGTISMSGVCCGNQCCDGGVCCPPPPNGNSPYCCGSGLFCCDTPPTFCC